MFIVTFLLTGGAAAAEDHPAEAEAVATALDAAAETVVDAVVAAGEAAVETEVVNTETVVALGNAPLEEPTEEAQVVDPLCEELFEQYLRANIINQKLVLAACTIIADRGRSTGYWQNVYAEMLLDGSKTKYHCLAILEKILRVDGTIRFNEQRPAFEKKIMKWTPQPTVIGEDVIATLISMCQDAEPIVVDPYLIALVHAFTPEAKDLFIKILTENLYSASSKFYAAVGLAQLGEPAAFEWLIKYSGHDLVLYSRCPESAQGNTLGDFCKAALRKLSLQDKKGTRTPKEWEAWWQEVKNGYRTKGLVLIED
ncbi:MAG: hypothetical protein JXA52_09925 [Planctomycetes bacterium]|nr:hypothetical protein [Planctomycetota bacterium]